MEHVFRKAKKFTEINNQKFEIQLDDGFMVIPFDPENKDYQEILKYIEKEKPKMYERTGDVERVKPKRAK